MKKNKYALFFAVLLFISNGITAMATAVSETGQEPLIPDTELIFDADVVTNRTAAKSALADMHGVFVFRSAFIMQEKLVKEAEKKNREEIETIVLTSEQPELDYQNWVDLVLTSETEKIIKDVYIEEEESTVFIWIYCIIISISILCMAIRIEDVRRKKKEGRGEIY